MDEQNGRKLIRKLTTNLLLGFVIFSIGFAVGKEVSANNSVDRQDLASTKEESVVVYYLRTTFRCWQCNLIEVYTEELIKNQFAEHLETGYLVWKVVDYLQHRELATQYNISGNTVIVAKHQDGEEVSNIRLDQVMEKVFNREEFMNYVREAIIKQMNPELLSMNSASQNLPFKKERGISS
jgi:predicted RNA-binding protein with TRAM domain